MLNERISVKYSPLSHTITLIRNIYKIITISRNKVDTIKCIEVLEKQGKA